MLDVGCQICQGHLAVHTVKALGGRGGEEEEEEEEEEEGRGMTPS